MGNKKSVSVPLANIVATKEDRSGRNEEPITIVWYDERSDDDRTFQRQTLRQINDYVIFFHDKNDFLHYIHSNQDEQIFIILVRSMVRWILVII